MRFLLFLLLYTSCVYAQKYDYVWQLGDGSGYGFDLNFNTSPVTISLNNRVFPIATTSFSMCDVNGNDLFSGNGFKVADITGNIMQNGTGLHGGDFMNIWINAGISLSNLGFTLPSPSNNKEYYLFQNYIEVAGAYYTSGLIYSKVNMNLNNGLGAITDKNVFVIQQDSLEFSSFTAVKHGNGRDWWLVQPQKGGQYIYTILFTPNGIEKIEKQKIQDTLSTQGLYSIFTPDGTKYIQYVGQYSRIMPFNRCTGTFGTPTFFDTPTTSFSITGGFSVSANSRVLYRITGDTIFQYDLWANNISLSEQVVGYWDGFMANNQPVGFSRAPQLAPNGKIYISSYHAFYHVIENPDSLGLACNFMQHLPLPSIMREGFPHFPNYRLGAAIGSGCDTLSVSNQVAVNSKQVKVYPNPAQNYVQVELPQGLREATFVLYNALGQVVQQTELQASTLVQLTVAKGLYFYEVIFKRGKSYGKLQVE